MLKKAAVCTDIHFGKKTNSKVHNEDCIRFLEWFRDQVKKDPEIDHIMFHYIFQISALSDLIGNPLIPGVE